MEPYNPSEIEPKWQKRWLDSKIYQPDLKSAEKPYYNLMMFPYPSAEGLHVGNVYAFTGSDIYGRFKRMQGYDVFEPIGLDGFGIHSENYALQTGVHPAKQAKINEERFYGQLKDIGSGFAWGNSLETYDPEYYKWTQWIFVQMFKRGLAYRAKSPVNWCPKDKTVLADEQVIAGCCERCGTPVEIRELEQWFFKITAFADHLLKNLEWIDWSEKVKLMQKNWIGKKEGAEIAFKTSEGQLWVFTTRADTLFGATFIAIAPSHPWAMKFTRPKTKKAVEDYIKKTGTKPVPEERGKTGVFSGSFAVNPINNKKVPIWISDYVMSEYGTGAVMGVPAHDQRDFEFAKKYKLPIIEVVSATGKRHARLTRSFVGAGSLVTSGKYNGIPSSAARKNIVNDLTKNKLARPKISWHLRDWLISRQRYWGPPIPMIYCKKHGWQPVPEDQLPVILPETDDYKPRDDGKSPLGRIESFVKTKCPVGGEPAERATEVSDTFLDSAWYFLRYPSVNDDNVPWEEKITKKWLPVDMYIGGAEHSVLHLLYSRFITMAFKDWGLLDFEEPFEKFRAHGLLIKEGAKMSKSKGNVIVPDDYIRAFGADTLRTYLMFLGPYGQGGNFQDKSIAGASRFLKRVWKLYETISPDAETDGHAMHKTIQKVTDDVENLGFNTAIATLMEYVNTLSGKESVSKVEYETLLQLLAPIAPHLTEELWARIKNAYSIHTSLWPQVDPHFLKETKVTLAILINGKVRDELEIEVKISGAKLEKLVLERPNIKTHLSGKKPKRFIHVPGKIINIVV
jgi:leucyl-tRNA synthetase